MPYNFGTIAQVNLTIEYFGTKKSIIKNGQIMLLVTKIAEITDLYYGVRDG
jgi:hypothetical protein